MGYAFQQVSPNAFYNKSRESKDRSMTAFSNMDRSSKTENEVAALPKTVGGGVSAAAGGATAGYAIGSAVQKGGGPWGAVIGTAIMGLSYLFS